MNRSDRVNVRLSKLLDICDQLTTKYPSSSRVGTPRNILLHQMCQDVSGASWLNSVDSSTKIYKGNNAPFSLVNAASSVPKVTLADISPRANLGCV
jgi:hypothetical protein